MFVVTHGVSNLGGPTMNTETTLRALRTNVDYEEGEWGVTYLENAKASEECSDLSITAFRNHLAALTKRGLYLPIDGYAWGRVKLRD